MRTPSYKVPGGPERTAPGGHGKWNFLTSNIPRKVANFNPHYRRFLQGLEALPKPGEGCHPELLGVANYGVMAGLPVKQIFLAIRAAIKPGARNISDAEIFEAVEKAVRECKNTKQRERRYLNKLKEEGRKKAIRKYQKRHKPIQKVSIPYKHDLEGDEAWLEAQIVEMSPVKIPHEPEEQAALVLTQIFRPSEFVFTGDQLSTGVHTAQYTASNIGKCLDYNPFIIPNPLTGQLAKTASGKWSYRCNAAVSDLRVAIAEFDNRTIQDQFNFWLHVLKKWKTPIVALIHSGGKSIHGWMAVNCRDIGDWNRRVKGRLFGEILEPLGVDPATKNPSRLSRLPGHYRAEKGQFQRLLYLNPKVIF